MRGVMQLQIQDLGIVGVREPHFDAENLKVLPEN